MLRNWFCPKCGAVADMEHRAAYMQADWDAQQAQYNAAVARWEELRKKNPLLAVRWPPDFDWERAELVRAGVQHGEHLACSCPRCKHSWVEPVLAATESTPIYDSMMS